LIKKNALCGANYFRKGLLSFSIFSAVRTLVAMLQGIRYLLSDISCAFPALFCELSFSNSTIIFKSVYWESCAVPTFKEPLINYPASLPQQL